MPKWRTVVGGKEYAFAFPLLRKKYQSLCKLFPKANLLLLKLGRGTYVY